MKIHPVAVDRVAASMAAALGRTDAEVFHDDAKKLVAGLIAARAAFDMGDLGPVPADPPPPVPPADPTENLPPG